MLKKDNITDQNKVKGVLGNIIALILKNLGSKPVHITSKINSSDNHFKGS